MWSLDRRARATLALTALASIACIATAEAKGENAAERHEQRPPGLDRHAARRTHMVPAQGFHAAPRREATPAREHREFAGRSITERRPVDGRVMAQSQPAGGGRVRGVSGALGAGPVRVVRYGNTLSGTVERTIRPGLTSRTFVGGGHVLYTHVYQRHVWNRFGRAFAYETFVPAVRYPAVYYSWALTAWPRPVVYTWGWQVQPWYPAYGPLFTPYPVYTSPDLWMTDYIIAQSMQTAFQARGTAPEQDLPSQDASAAPPPESSIGVDAASPGDVSPTLRSSDVPPAPAASRSSDEPSAPAAMPPAITPEIKAQLNAQIKVQLREQQAAAATPAILTTQSTPPALRPNHVFFQVVQPLDVPSATANGHCSLGPNDYIKRTGPMSNDDWKIPVEVELSRPPDCPEGLQTRVGLNDLNAMENEQEAQVIQAMQAASKSMGPNGPPSGPGARPTLIADGSTAPDPRALDAMRQAQ